MLALVNKLFSEEAKSISWQKLRPKKVLVELIIYNEWLVQLELSLNDCFRNRQWFKLDSILCYRSQYSAGK